MNYDTKIHKDLRLSYAQHLSLFLRHQRERAKILVKHVIFHKDYWFAQTTDTMQSFHFLFAAWTFGCKDFRVLNSFMHAAKQSFFKEFAKECAMLQFGILWDVHFLEEKTFSWEKEKSLKCSMRQFGQPHQYEHRVVFWVDLLNISVRQSWNWYWSSVQFFIAKYHTFFYSLLFFFFFFFVFFLLLILLPPFRFRLSLNIHNEPFPEKSQTIWIQPLKNPNFQNAKKKEFNLLFSPFVINRTK